MSAPTIQLITASDFIGKVIFTENLPANDLKGFVLSVVKDDLQPKIMSSLYERITEVYNLTYSASTIYTAGQEIAYLDRGYVCLSTTTAGQNPVTHPAKWSEIEIYSVWRDYIKEYLIHRTFAKWLTWGGVKITNAGVVTHSDASYNQVSDERRARLSSIADKNADLAFTKFLKYMDDVNYIIDSIDYTPVNITKFKPKTRISAI
jgi:hypothetical protein